MNGMRLVLANGEPIGSPLPPAPAEIGGMYCPNRLPLGSGLLRAENDREAILAWLATVSTSPHTQASYLKEADRLYRWAIMEKGVPISALTHEDLQDYARFLADPQPAELWVSSRRVARTNPAWKPFNGPLQTSSIRLAMSVINAMFSWLVEARYLAANPMVLTRRRRNSGVRRITRLLSSEQIAAVWSYLETLPTVTPSQKASSARIGWILSLALITGLRISELSSSRMADLYWIKGRDGEQRWFLEVIGKGQKVRQVPLPNPLLDKLKQYRESLGLSPLPQPAEEWPLILKQRRSEPSLLVAEPMTRQALHKLIKSSLKGGAEWLRSQGNELIAQHLEHASAHWLRHTAASRMGDAGVPPHAIMETLGHADLSTTSLYLHRDLEDRHKELASVGSIGLG